MCLATNGVKGVTSCAMMLSALRNAYSVEGLLL